MSQTTLENETPQFSSFEQSGYSASDNVEEFVETISTDESLPLPSGKFTYEHTGYSDPDQDSEDEKSENDSTDTQDAETDRKGNKSYPKLYKRNDVECQYIYTFNFKNVPEDVRGGHLWHKLPFAHLHLDNMDTYPMNKAFDIFRFGDRFSQYKEGQGSRYVPPKKLKKYQESSISDETSSSPSNSQLIKMISNANLSRTEISNIMLLLSAKLL